MSSGAEAAVPLVKTRIPYRPHIDGLRGLSIIVMILFHAKFFGDTGGFIGVDIFFVISGFLITSIIVRDIHAGQFSLVKFWERRIRRIIPPLFLMMLFVSVAGYFLILYPQDYHHLGNALIAQSLFVSNILFTLTDNYFDTTSQFSPLLHTWTLSLEEQFYLFFPFLVLLCVWCWRKWKGKRERSSWQKFLLAAVALLGLASFALNMWFVTLSPSAGLKLPFVSQGVFWQTSLSTAGFYLLPTRAWEMGLGIALALTGFTFRSKKTAEIASAAGLALILGGVFLLNPGMPYPGIAALVPTLGTLLVIAGNEEWPTLSGRLLSTRALVGIGLISYALYLWYWPLFVLTGVITLFSPTPLDFVVAIALALLMAMLSYRFVETPIRKKEWFSTTRSAYVFGIGAMALVLVLGIFVQRSAFAQSSRVPAAATSVLAVAQEEGQTSAECFSSPSDTGAFAGMCHIGAKGPGAHPDFIIWGDSHADAMAPALHALGQTYNVSGAVIVDGACLPVISAHQSPPATGCEGEKSLALNYIETHDIKHIFLIARWTYYVEGGPNAVRVAYITDSGQVTTSPAEARQVLARTLAPEVERFTGEGRQVIIVEQVPEQLHYDTRTLFYATVRAGMAVPVPSVSAAENAAYQARSNSVINALAGTPGVTVIDPTSLFCQEGGPCALEKSGTLLYKDENHLSVAGALSLQPLFAPVFAQMAQGR